MLRMGSRIVEETLQEGSADNSRTEKAYEKSWAFLLQRRGGGARLAELQQFQNC
jgi:hypothetical protein